MKIVPSKSDIQTCSGMLVGFLSAMVAILALCYVAPRPSVVVYEEIDYFSLPTLANPPVPIVEVEVPNAPEALPVDSEPEVPSAPAPETLTQPDAKEIPPLASSPAPIEEQEAAPVKVLRGTATVEDGFHARVIVGTTDLGSGTYCYDDGKTGVILSCSHMFDQKKGPIEVVMPGGIRVPGRLKARDGRRDMSVIYVDSLGITPAEISTEKRTCTFTFCGYGEIGDLQCKGGVITDKCRGQGDVVDSCVIGGVAARHGDSGCGVFNDLGQLAGVLWGSADGDTYFTSTTDSKDWIASHMPNYKAQPAKKQLRKLAPAVKQKPQQEEAQSGDIKIDLRANKLVIISMADSQCPPCAAVHAITDVMIAEGYDIERYMYNEYTGPEKHNRYPTMLFYRDGELVHRSGGLPRREIEQRLTKEP